MGILQRFADIMSANINALLDKCEDPEKMIDQTLRKLNDSLADVKKETAGVMAEESRCKRNLEAAQKDVEKWDGYARKALTAGNEGDAREFLAKKSVAESKYTEAKQVYDLAHDNSTKMRQMHDKLVNDISQLESRRDTLKAKVAVAKTQETINKATSGVNVSGTMAQFDSLEGRINKRLDAAMAEAELNSKPLDTATELAEKYDHGADGANVDAELAKLKAEMGIQ